MPDTMQNETVQDAEELGHQVYDPSLAVAAALAELELLQAETYIAMAEAQRFVVAAEPPAVSDLSPLGRRRL